MQLFKSQMKEDVEMNDKTEIKTDKISQTDGYFGHAGWSDVDILLGYGKGAACDKERAHTYQCDKPYRIFGNACADRRMHNKDDIHGRQKRYK